MIDYDYCFAGIGDLTIGVTVIQAMAGFDLLSRYLNYGHINFETMTEYNGFLVEV